MPKAEWGTKRICPTTGKRFYDLNKSPIVSPYTGEVVDIESVRRKMAASVIARAVPEKDDDVLVEDIEADDDLLPAGAAEAVTDVAAEQGLIFTRLEAALDSDGRHHRLRTLTLDLPQGKAHLTLALDGDLLNPGAPMDKPGQTERAVRQLSDALRMDDRAIRDALERGNRLDFGDTDLYARVYALAEARAGKPLPRAMIPGIKLESPKITRELTTAWFATRVDERYRHCLQR